MKILVILLSLFSINVLANDFKIKVMPERPVVNEPFQIEFRIKTKADVDPIVDFEPLGIDIIEVGDKETSSTIQIYGTKRIFQKEHIYRYTAVAKRPGGQFLRNITVNIDGNILKKSTFKIDIVKTAVQAPKVFAKAVLDKTSAYVGESILIRYYIYYQDNIVIRQSPEIKKFPKLDKFLKRFYQEMASTERVVVDGKRYARRLIYTAQVFADKPGDYKVDPITLRAVYQNRQSLRGFNFDFSFGGRPLTKTTSSKVQTVEIKPLPLEGMPPQFSGLIGKHDFSLKINKNKFIANEPIEITLRVKGKGALELFEAPMIITDPSFEEFEKSSDFVNNKDFSAEKTISYTYLGRENVKIPNKEIPMSYFDPTTMKYETVMLKLGDIVVGGARPADKKKIEKKATAEEGRSDVIAPVIKEKTYTFKPILKVLNTYVYNVKQIFVILLVILLLIMTRIVYLFFPRNIKRETNSFDEIYKNGVSYAGLHKVLNTGNGGKMNEMVDKLNISASAKTYFLKLIEDLDRDYDKNKVEKNIKINKKYFKELEKAKHNNDIYEH